MSEDDGEWSPWEREEPEEDAPLIQPSQQQCEPDAMEETTPIISATPSHRTQYLTALAATMGALAMGAVLGYSAPAGPKLMTNSSSSALVLTTAQNMWFSSSMNLGALAGGPVGGFCINALGRRGTMLASIVPFLSGWALIGLARNYGMLMAGRILTGLCCGVTSLTVPTYIGEYASADIRGTLGSAFQLMVTIGVLYAYVVGAVVATWQLLAGLCAVPAVLYFCLVFFARESPCFLLAKGRRDEAEAALQYFRGAQHNIQTEMNLLEQSLEDARRNKASLKDLLTPYILKPLLISLTLMFFQQFSGVNPVLFNLNTIFKDSGSSIPGDVSAIIIGGVQVAATLAAVVLMDRAGRKALLVVSSAVMALALTGLGEFFYEKMVDETWAIRTLGWVPLASLVLFITAFSIGYGPIPWLMMGELFSPNVKEAAASLATLVNWGLSFVATLIFVPLQSSIGDYGVYWLFGGVCVVNLVFCVSTVPETKGRTLDEIAAHFGAPANTSTRDNREQI